MANFKLTRVTYRNGNVRFLLYQNNAVLDSFSDKEKALNAVKALRSSEVIKEEDITPNGINN